MCSGKSWFSTQSFNDRNMKKVLLLLIATGFTFLSFCQSSDLKQAIKHYEAKNLGLAEKEIEKAIQTQFTSKDALAKAMYFYFNIKADLYCTTDQMSTNMDRLPRLGEAYNTCIKNDTNDKYDSELNDRVANISAQLEDEATKAYTSNNFLEYFQVLDYRLSFMEMIDKENVREYEELAHHAAMLKLYPLQIKYLKKMIRSGYNEQYAFKKLLAGLHKLEKYEEVDEVLLEAKTKYPESDMFAVTEIKRLLDKDLKFSAMQMAKKVIAKDPVNAEVIFQLGIIYTSLGEHDRAVANFQEVAVLAPDHSENQLELGKYFYKFSSQNEGHLDSARAHLEKAFQLRPNENIAKELLDEVYLKLGLVKDSAVSSSGY